jgi:hypothetical protein
MKIKVFMHINDLPGSSELLSEQLTLASESGLLDAADEWILCCNGQEQNFVATIDALKEFTNIKLVHTSDTVHMWEYPSLNLLKQYCDLSDEEDFYVCYYHLKGLSRLGDQRVTDWRRYMEYWLVEKWEQNVALLDEGYDVVGTNFIEAPWLHTSGNFWWSHANYIRTLDPLVHPDNLPWGTQSKYINAILDGGNFRYEHEAWIGSKNPKWAEIHASPGKTDSGWHFENLYPREKYETSNTED